MTKDYGVYIDFHYFQFSKKCSCCNQVIAEEGLIDLNHINKTNRKNKERKI